MRRFLVLAAAALAICASAPAAHAQTLDDIIAANLKSKGGLDKIKATTTVRMSGSVVARDMNGQNVKGTMVTVAKRPNLMRRDATLGTHRIVNAFDGSPGGGGDGEGATPVPVSATSCGEPEALSVNLRAVARLPVAVGEKRA